MPISEAEQRLLDRLAANRKQLEYEFQAGNIDAALALLNDRIKILNEAIADNPELFQAWNEFLVYCYQTLRRLKETAYEA